SAAAEDLHAIEVGAAADAIDFGDELVDLRLQAGAFARAVRRIGGLQGELAAALQEIRDLGQSALGGLQQGDGVVRIARRLVEAADLRGHAFGNGEAGRVV